MCPTQNRSVHNRMVPDFYQAISYVVKSVNAKQLFVNLLLIGSLLCTSIADISAHNMKNKTVSTRKSSGIVKSSKRIKTRAIHENGFEVVSLEMALPPPPEGEGSSGDDILIRIER